MQLYLSQQYCSRGVLSQFLDSEPHWRWCMADDVTCQVCQVPHSEARPAGVPFSLAATASAVFTGLEEVLRQGHIQEQARSRYEQDLELALGSCLYCRAMGRPFDHAAIRCARRFDWIRAKKAVLATCHKQGKRWIAPYMAC
jgi:hypothetical protein